MNVVNDKSHSTKYKLIALSVLFGAVMTSAILYVHAKQKKRDTHKILHSMEDDTQRMKTMREEFKPNVTHKNINTSQNTRILPLENKTHTTENTITLKSEHAPEEHTHDEHSVTSPQPSYSQSVCVDKNNMHSVYEQISCMDNNIYMHAHTSLNMNNIQAVILLIINKQNTKGYTYYTNEHAVESTLYDTDNIKDVILYIYNIQRKNLYGIPFNDTDAQQFKRVSFILYGYILYDKDLYLKYKHNKNEDLLVDEYVFNYQQSLNYVAKAFVRNAIQSVHEKDKIDEVTQFVNSLCNEIVTVAKCVRHMTEQTKGLMFTLCARVHTYELRKFDRYDTQFDTMSIMLNMFSSTIVNVYNRNVKIAYLNIGNVSSVLSTLYIDYKGSELHMPREYMYTQYNHCVRFILHTYILNHFTEINDQYINVGYEMAVCMHPYNVLSLPFDNYDNVTEVQESAGLTLKDSGIVYIGGSLCGLSTFSAFEKTAQTLHDYNMHSVSEMCADKTGGTYITQNFSVFTEEVSASIKHHKFFVYSSFVKLSNLISSQDEEYNEYNVSQNIPLGSVVMKTCLEIIESYFNLLMNNRLLPGEQISSNTHTHTDVIYTKMHMFIDVPERNIYASSKYAIRQMYAKTMSYILTILNTKKEDILHILMSDNKQFSVKHYYEAYAYLQKLQIIVVHTDTLRDDEKAQLCMYTNSTLAHTQQCLLQYIQQNKHKVPYVTEYILSTIAHNAILRPLQAIKQAQSLQYDRNNTIDKLMLHISEELMNYMRKAPKIPLYTKYQLQDEHFLAQHTDTEQKDKVDSVPVRYVTSAQEDYALHALFQKIDDLMKKYNVEVNNEYTQHARETLVHHIQNIATKLNARKLMTELSMCDLEDINNDAEIDALLRCNDGIG